MKVDLKNINIYYLTCDTNCEKKKHLVENFKGHKLTEVMPKLGIGKYKSGASGHSRMLDLGVRDQDRTKPFQPFIVVEDDVIKTKKFKDEIDIPDDADLLYVGISAWGLIGDKGKKGGLFLTQHDDKFVRVYNMLSTHGIMVCSAAGLLAMQKCMMECFINNVPFDIPLASQHPFYNVYACKKPMLYQLGRIGGKEDGTKVTIGDEWNNMITDEFIKKDCPSVINHMKRN